MRDIDYTELSDDELYELALEKRPNGNGSTRAYKAQRELAARKDPYKLRWGDRQRSKKFAHNREYMGFETDNR